MVPENACGRSPACLRHMVLTLLLLLPVACERLSPPEWKEVWIGPPTGDNTRISTTAINSEGMSLKVLIAIAHDIQTTRIIGPPLLDSERYAVVATPDTEEPPRFRALLQKLLAGRFNLAVHRETRELPVYVVKPAPGAQAKLPVVTEPPNMNSSKGDLSGRGPLSTLIRSVEGRLGRPVVDESGLTKSYKYELSWKAGDRETLLKSLETRLGLLFEPAQRKVEVLVVDRVEKLRNASD
ncbi:MAG: TIGR03435 family protein [Bryobacteraceae bacterium]